MRTRDQNIMDKSTLGILLLGATVALSACSPRTDDAVDSGTGQPLFNANGEGTDGSVVVTPPAIGAANPDALSFIVVSDVSSINTGGTDVANITALVRDVNNNAVAAQDVTFSSTGGVLQNISQTTDENGEASATLRLLQDFQNQDIIVTVSSEAFEAAVRVTALGSTLDVSGPDTLVSGDQAELVLSLNAGNGEPISNQVVAMTSTAGNSIEPAVAITDADGRVSVLVGTENSNDTVQISALGGTVTASHAFEVSSDVLQFADGTRDSELPVSQENLITVVWTSQSSSVVGRELRFSTTAGEIVGDSIVITNVRGEASVLLRSSSAGPATITVEAADDSRPITNVDVEFVATTPAQVAIDASSTRVNANETSTVTAFVTDANGNPVKNQTVDFTSADLKGGQLNPASSTSNSAGIASVTFTAGDSATEVDDIVIVSQVKSTSIADTLTLTVVERVLNVTIGTSNEINIKPLGTQYAMPFIVQVADGSGTPLEDATVRLSVRPITYLKGRMVQVNAAGQPNDPSLTDWVPDHWALLASNSVVCPSEDANGNRILDADATMTEDRNGNGSLDPQDPAALTAVEGDEFATIEGGSLSTDQNGSGFFELLYPASNSMWSFVEITARAEALGAESEDSFRTILPLPASEANAADEVPANISSPYGVLQDPFDFTVDADGNSIECTIAD